MSGAPALAYRRLRAPRENGGVLVDPAWESIPRALFDNCRRKAAYSYDVQGRSLTELAALARAELVRGARDYTAAYRDVPTAIHADRLFLAGHQPQLFHPGVWLKNFALGELAGRQGGLAINLVIDSDTIKVASLKVPGGSIELPWERVVPFDRSTAEIPFEDRPIIDRELLRGFARQACEIISPLVRDPLVCQFWPLVVERSEATNNLGECLAQARHRLEGQWGLNSLEFPQSRVCQLEAFAWFAVHLFDRLASFREIYNSSVLDYRQVHGLRSANHPVPLLEADQEWLEAPFWVWHAASPRRRRLFVRRRADELELTNREDLTWTLPLASDGDPARAVEALRNFPARGIRLRTKALVTTLFARLFLGDLFMHGIGGGKYDQVTDLLIRRFFGVEPPAYVILSGTLELPIPRARATIDDARNIARKLRELTYHPERFLDEAAGESPSASGEVRDLLATKRQLIESSPPRGQGKQRRQEIRRLNELLQPRIEGVRRRLARELEDIERRLAAERVLSNREFAFCLHPEQTLRGFLLDFCRGSP